MGVANVTQLALRVAILAAVALVAGLTLYIVQRYVARQRRLALAAHPDEASFMPRAGAAAAGDGASTPRILAFSSPYCSPCHTLQEPALRRIAAARGSAVVIETLDATEHAELAARYRVMTVPATVVFDAMGQPTAVNYGYAPAEKLLAQLAAAEAPELALAR